MAHQQGQQRVGPMVELPPLLREWGLSPAEVLAQVDLPADALNDPNRSIPFETLGRLLEACATATSRPDFGLLLGRRSGLASFGLVGELMRHAPTFGAALIDLTGNQHRYVRGAIPYLLVDSDFAVLGYAVYQEGVPGLDQIHDTAAAVGLNTMLDLIDTGPDEVLLAHRAPADTAPYRQMFGVPITFDATQTALIFPAALLSRPIAGRDPVRREALEQTIKAYWMVTEPDVATQLMRYLRPLMTTQVPSAEDAAAALSLHPRTLHRRLREEGTSFRRTLNAARFEVARQLLSSTGISMTEMSMAFGYADATAFSRAFHRWSGVSPSTWRTQARRAA